MSWQRMRHQMCGTGAQLGSGPRRDVAARAELMFDYCDVTDNDPVWHHFAWLIFDPQALVPRTPQLHTPTSAAPLARHRYVSLSATCKHRPHLTTSSAACAQPRPLAQSAGPSHADVPY